MKITKKIHNKLSEVFNEIQQPRTNYELENLVVGARYTEPQAYAQCVLELSIKYDALRLTNIDMSIKQLEINELSKNKPISERNKLEIAKKEIELEQIQRAYLGAEREFEYLYHLWSKFPKQYTREELNNNSELEFKTKLKTQALLDLESMGKISVGNLEGLRQMNINKTQLTLPEQRDEVETKYLEEGKLRALIIIPSEHRMTATQIDELLKDVVFPTNVEMRIENIAESPVADNYNVGIEKAIKEGCTHLITLEDDQVLEKDSLIRLFEFALDNQDACVGAYYPKRQPVREGVHIILKGGHRRFIKDDGKVQELKTMAMGLSIYPTEILKQIDFPYCKTTNSLSQDSYLSQKIRDKGYKLLCDTSIKIGHKDRDGTIYY